ncbi:MarR family winged helix-turn-helix transcriptional regulator [Galactobacter valiniphilus]|nr:MarR family transcriptional regulator [Galactobacter valiniphilus]
MSGGMNPVRWEVVRLLQDVTVASDRYVDAAARAEGLHRTDLHALSAVVRHQDANEPLTISALAQRLDLSAPATTALVDRMERNGHVERERSERDRRRVTLASTDSARSTGARLFMPLGRAIDSVTSRYSDEELALVARFLDEAAEAITEAGPIHRDPRAVSPAPPADAAPGRPAPAGATHPTAPPAVGHLPEPPSA